MRVTQLGETRKQRGASRQGSGWAERDRALAEQLARRLYKQVRVVVNVNEDMSCSRIRSFLGG